MTPKWCTCFGLLLFSTAAVVRSTSSDSNSTLFYLRDLKQNKNGVPAVLPKRLFTALPPFAPVDSVNEACRNDSLQFLHDLYNFDLRALSMFDASAKLPSGILSGNVNQFGDLDQCLEADGQYCLAMVDLKLSGTESHTLHTVHTLIKSHNAFRSTLQDPGHRVPRFSAINWGVCVPKSCTPADVEASLNAFAEGTTRDTGFKAIVKINEEMCQVISEEPLSGSVKLVASLFIGLFLVIAASTLTEYSELATTNKSLSMEIFKGFSLIKNCKKLFSMDVPADDISSVHGIRFVNAIMLYFAHKSMAMFFNPYVNRTKLAEALGQPWTVIARAASLYTDPFIMMSGLLTCYTLGKQMQKTQTINVPKEIISRLSRLMPTLGALILFCTFILPNMGSGPQWPLVIKHHSELCKSYWWRNMLFIHNYFGFQNMCLTHTHHVGIDTQLFMVSPLLVYLAYKWPKQGMISLLSIGVGSTILRFYVTYMRQLNTYVSYGSTITQMFNTADYSYTLPTHRATVYVMGIALGYILKTWGRDVKLKNSYLTLGWFIALCTLYQSVVHPAKMGDRFYVYDRWDAANYAAFAPVTWCFFFAWIIFTSHTGNGGFVARMFSHPFFQITTRLAYTFYLTQFPVFFYNVGRKRYSGYYSIFLMLDGLEIVSVISATICLTLAVEMPFQNIRTVFLKNPKGPPTIKIDSPKVEKKLD